MALAERLLTRFFFYPAPCGEGRGRTPIRMAVRGCWFSLTDLSSGRACDTKHQRTAVDSLATMRASTITTVTQPERTALRVLLLSSMLYLEWCCSGKSPLCSRQPVEPNCIQIPDNCNVTFRCAYTDRTRCRSSVKRVSLILVSPNFVFILRRHRLRPTSSPSIHEYNQTSPSTFTVDDP